ncbi:MAG: thiamine diphosphokinase [Chloroflexi bacterium]|uniref:Thiamine diphosphokinase n=2 Tax=Candidatus Chlorohelix allophototropha TaxID=3003348 RepID=A0A8T7M094_9CHLR|nr:thiamine diphosphokinase [Chloroflexota bacterium]
MKSCSNLEDWKVMRKAIILAYIAQPLNNSRLKKFTQEAVAAGALLICADSAGEAALAWDLLPHWLVGDMDSIAPAVLRELTARPSVKVDSHPAEKDETDLELAIERALSEGATEITIVGGVGGRLDHTLGNLYLLAMPSLARSKARVRILSENEEVFLLSPDDSPLLLEGKKGELVSLFPFNGDATGVYTENLYYPLRHETLYFGPSRGISNVMLAESAEISLEEGRLLIIHTFAQS